MPTWLQNLIRPVSNAVRVIPRGIVPALESLNAAVEIEKAKKAGLSTPESLKRAGSVVFTGIEAARGGPTGIALVAAPPTLRMAAEGLRKNYGERPMIGIDPLRGYGPSAKALEMTANALDWLDPTAWAARFSDMGNPEVMGVPLGQNPNQNLEQMKDFLLQKAKEQ